MIQDAETLKSDISNLVNRWIELEKHLRLYSGPMYEFAAGRAMQVSVCRRQLQEIAKLVVKPEEL